MKVDDIKFVFFSLGMGVAIASLLTSIYLLSISMLGGKSIVFEDNPVVAIVEMVLLVFAIGTCIVATGIYQRYRREESISDPKRV